MPKFARRLIKFFLIITAVAGIFSVVIYAQLQNEKQKQFQQEITVGQATGPDNDSLTTSSDLIVEGDLTVRGEAEFESGVRLSSLDSQTDKVLSLDGSGNLVLVDDATGEQNIIEQATNDLPAAKIGGMLYSDGNAWLVSSVFYHDIESSAPLIGIGTTDPEAKLHVSTANKDSKGLIVRGEFNQAGNLTEWQNSAENVLIKITPNGKMIFDSSADHMIELRPSGDTGYLSSSGGALFIENSFNIGTGIGIYSNAGADALGNMINIKVDNPLYSQAAFYMNYDGSSNAVEIVSNSTDSSSNALSVTGNNPNDSTVGFIGYETGKGTLKISHNGTGSDDNASGLSIDLQGTGTDAQGIYVDSTATGGTGGNLLRLRNESLDRFVVGPLGAVTIGRNGTDTSVTKVGNTVGDEYFIGTNGAFRVQRSATNSEAFRTQILGDTQGRWLGTSDGKLKFGDGSSAQDVTLERVGVGIMQLDDSLTVSKNIGLGTSTFNATGDNLLAFFNGTAPSASLTDGVQLWAEDVAASSELRVRDEAGNVNTISPHNFSLIPGGPSEDMAWSFYSERGDIAINADLAKALRIVEDLSGEQIVYIRNLATGDYIAKPTASPAVQTSDEKLELMLGEVLKNYVAKKDLEKHASLTDRVWTFITELVFKAKAVFESSVEFLANATFRGTITVNADTAGKIMVPANSSKFEVSFTKPFDKAPLVYLSSDNSEVKHSVSNVNVSGFTVEILNPQPVEMQFQWLALLSESGDTSSFKVLESSEVNPQIVVPPTFVVRPTPEATDSAAVE